MRLLFVPRVLRYRFATNRWVSDPIRGPCRHGEAQQTPITPVSTTGLVSLLDRIQHESHTLDEISVQRRQRHIQKLANAAQISFAERTLQQDQIRFLATINNEAQVRRSTKRVVLGKAKVMSYEDLEEARARRAAKVLVANRYQVREVRKQTQKLYSIDSLMSDP